MMLFVLVTTRALCVDMSRQITNDFSADFCCDDGRVCQSNATYRGCRAKLVFLAASVCKRGQALAKIEVFHICLLQRASHIVCLACAIAIWAWTAIVRITTADRAILGMLVIAIFERARDRAFSVAVRTFDF
jgi:hypothetical protein